MFLLFHCQGTLLYLLIKNLDRGDDLRRGEGLHPAQKREDSFLFLFLLALACGYPFSQTITTTTPIDNIRYI